MKELNYKIEFFSNWHTGSGLSAGADLDLLVIKDKNGLPYIPGKTLKGLLKDAALTINEFSGNDEKFIIDIFGKKAEKIENSNRTNPSKPGLARFSNAILDKDLQRKISKSNSSKLLFKKISSTAIAKDGQTKEHSLRRMEVTVPLTLFAKIKINSEKNYDLELTNCMKMIKRLGTNRNRGLGRCEISIIGGNK